MCKLVYIFMCSYFVLWLSLSLSNNVAGLEFGGAGYAVNFQKDMVAFGDYQFPQSSQGISISFWLKTMKNIGSQHDMQLLTTSSNSTRFRNLLGISIGENNWISFSVGEEKFRYMGYHEFSS